MMLKSTQSGKAGEYNILAKISRFGFKVSKPQWDDDEVDYEICWGEGDLSVNVQLQVKSVQFSDKADKAFIQGLKKKYVERNRLLCLAIYNPDSDWMWLMFGSDRIVEVYESQAQWNGKHRLYSSLEDNDDIRIAVPRDGQAFHSKYRVGIDDHLRVASWIEEVASRKKVRILSSSHDREPSVAISSGVRFLFNDGKTVNIAGEQFSYDAEGTVADLLTLAYNTIRNYVEAAFQQDPDRALVTWVLRELIVNAFAHRSYRSGAPIEITFSRNSIEVANPGGLPDPLSIADFNAKSLIVVRNPRLVQDLVHSRVMENMGAGIARVEHMIKEHGLSQVEFAQAQGRFVAAVRIGKAKGSTGRGEAPRR